MMPKMFENALKISSFWEVYLRKYNKRKKSKGFYVLELVISEYAKKRLGRMWITCNLRIQSLALLLLKEHF